MSYTRRIYIRRGISKTTITSLVVSMTLAACAVGPNYTPPRSELVPFHNLADFSGAKSPSTTPLDRWWLGFNDPVLVTLVKRALDQNLDLAAALARVHQARAAARGAGVQLMPTADLVGSATFEHQSLRGLLGTIAGGLPTFVRNPQEYVVGPAASWEIDLFGGLRRAAAASHDEAQAAEADHAGTRVIVAADTAGQAMFALNGRDAIAETSTEVAPWYVIPADHKWFRNWVVSKILVDVLDEMDPRYPEPPPLEGLTVS